MVENKEKKATILVIEDDPDVLSILAKHLEHVGYEVKTASDGLEGLKALDSIGYDLIITDVVMPFVSGLGVVSTIKAKSPHIPVIVITGYGAEPESIAIEQKADLVLAKPIKAADLISHIKELLERK